MKKKGVKGAQSQERRLFVPRKTPERGTVRKIGRRMLNVLTNTFSEEEEEEEREVEENRRGKIKKNR